MEIKNKFYEETNFSSEADQIPIDLPIPQIVYKEFSSSRNILIAGPIDQKMAFKVMLLLLHMDQEDDSLPIKMYIDSPGGSVTAGFTIIDTMRIIRAPVYTICFGLAASMGALILTAGTKGKRFATEHALVMIHQPWQEMNGAMKQSDLESYAKSMKRSRDDAERLLSETTGKDIRECHDAMERDNFMAPDEAMKMGIIDKIIIGNKSGIFGSTEK